uniref:Uncharacterized protein n=1 Tax=Athene cunicularia TaxID=194338 RepID=A0A663MB00_ATHCN
MDTCVYCTCLYLCIHMYVGIYMCVQTSMSVYVCVHTHAHVCTETHIPPNACVRPHTPVHVCTCVCSQRTPPQPCQMFPVIHDGCAGGHSPGCWAAEWETVPVPVYQHCFCFASVVKPGSGHPQQEGESSSETSGYSYALRPPSTLRGSSAPGASLLTSTLTPGCMWPHTSPRSPNPAPNI